MSSDNKIDLPSLVDIGKPTKNTDFLTEPLPDDGLDTYEVAQSGYLEEEKAYYSKIENPNIENPDSTEGLVRHISIISDPEPEWKRELDYHIIDTSENITDIVP